MINEDSSLNERRGKHMDPLSARWSATARDTPDVARFRQGASRCARVGPRIARPSRQGHRQRPALPAVTARRCLPGLALAALVVIVGCGKSELKPVDLQPEDMCSNCKMAISEKRFASEIIDREGRPFKFDDLGCLRHYVSTGIRKEDVAAWFVMDFGTKTWCDARAAWYVRSDSYRTPMGSGIIAFRDQSAAAAAAAEAAVPVQRFDDLFR